jgi:hypothetical protein
LIINRNKKAKPILKIYLRKLAPKINNRVHFQVYIKKCFAVFTVKPTIISLPKGRQMLKNKSQKPTFQNFFPLKTKNY